MNKCECGCGLEVSRAGNRFVHGHNGRGVKNPRWTKMLREDHPMRRPEVAAKVADKMRGNNNPMRRNPELCHLKGKTGDQHPKWKGGGKDYRGPQAEWNEARRLARERADRRCEKCGDQSQLVVHHLESPEDGVSWNNNIENLEAICRSCHAKEHDLGGNGVRF